MLGVLLQADETGSPYVAAAGGLMIQIMPGAAEKTIASIESSVSRTPQTTTMIREGASSLDLLRTALGPIDFEILDEREVGFACPCSFERAVSLIASIDRRELEAMLREDRGAVMTCHFCNESYRVDESELESIIESSK